MHRVDQQELDIALAYLTGALPCRAEGVALLKVDGTLIAQYLRTHDGTQLASLFDSAMYSGVRLTSAMHHGDLRYTVTAGASGITLTLMLGEDYLLFISAAQVKSLDGMLYSAQEGLAPLLDVLGLRTV